MYFVMLGYKIVDFRLLNNTIEITLSEIVIKFLSTETSLYTSIISLSYESTALGRCKLTLTAGAVYRFQYTVARTISLIHLSNAEMLLKSCKRSAWRTYQQDIPTGPSICDDESGLHVTGDIIRCCHVRSGMHKLSARNKPSEVDTLLAPVLLCLINSSYFSLGYVRFSIEVKYSRTSIITMSN